MQHKEFFNDNNGKVGTKSSIKHRRNANKNHHLKRQPTGKITRRGKFYIRPPYFRIYIMIYIINITAAILNQITRYV